MPEASTHLPLSPSTVAASPTELQSHDSSLVSLPPIIQQLVDGNEDDQQIIVYNSVTDSSGMGAVLYRAAESGTINELRGLDNWMHQKTPRGNNVLHIHVDKPLEIHWGVVIQNVSISFIQYVLDKTSGNSLLSKANSKGDTPLHVAARCGHTEAVQEFLNRPEVEIHGLLNKVNNSNDTALHDAARGGYADIVKLLVEARGDNENDLQHNPNKLRETPLFLAAERGSTETFDIIVRHTSSAALTHRGPCGQTPLHAAVLCGNKEIVNQIMQQYDNSSTSLIRLKNDQGQTPLHCCARNVKKYHKILRVLLSYDNEYNSAAYIQDNEGRTPLHIAAFDHNYKGIRMLIRLSPDCIEMIDNKGQNVMHYAAKTGRLRTFGLLLKRKYNCERLRNEKDNDGNTPMHILAAVMPNNSIDDWRLELPEFIRGYKNMDVMAFNNNNLTAGDVIYSNDTFLHLGPLQQPYKMLPRGRRINNGDHIRTGTERRETINNAEAKESSKKIREERLSNLKKISDTRLVVAALIATVSFTAGFTLPGGFDQSPGQKIGLAVLVKKTAFVAFLISDTIAFTFSSLAIMFYFLIASTNDLSLVDKASMLAQQLNSLSLGALMIAFVTGVYAVVSPSLGETVLLISLFFFVPYLGLLVANSKLIWPIIIKVFNIPAPV